MDNESLLHFIIINLGLCRLKCKQSRTNDGMKLIVNRDRLASSHVHIFRHSPDIFFYRVSVFLFTGTILDELLPMLSVMFNDVLRRLQGLQIER
jgi:hypothetical protein